MTADPAAHIVRPAPLTASAVEEFVTAALGQEAEHEFVEACVRATRGTPLLLRSLVEALRDELVVPDASSAAEVERIGARTVARSLQLRLSRLPASAVRLARALAILEQAELREAAELAAIDADDAANAADALVGAGIVEAGRPLSFVHSIVRTAVYSQLTMSERSRGHRDAARILARDRAENERAVEHLLVSEPLGDSWVVERLVEAARSAARRGAPESAATFLSRAVAEPPPADERSRLLLELGMAEASAGTGDWLEHLTAAIDAAADETVATHAAMVLALALSRAQRLGQAVEVLERAAARLGGTNPQLGLLVEAAAVGAGMNGAVTAHTVSARRQAIRARATEAPDAPPELLAVAAFIAVLGNEPAEVGAELDERAVRAGGVTPSYTDERPWYSFATWFSQSTVSLIWAERFATVRPFLDASIADGRAHGDSSRLAVGLAHRGWLALRRGDLRDAEADTRTALAAAALPAPTLYRVLNAGILIETLVEQGELDPAADELAPFDLDAETGSLTAIVLRFARGRLRAAQGRLEDALDDFRGVGTFATRRA